MPAARDTNLVNIKPLEGAIIRRYTAGATVVPGQVVAMQADGKIDPANTTSVADRVVGIALSGGGDTDIIDVVVFGPVQSITGGTPAAIVYAQNTAGQVGETAGTNAAVAGFVESITVLFVRPEST